MNCRFRESGERPIRTMASLGGCAASMEYDGGCMNRNRKYKPICVLLLLLAETVQGLTPDLDSLASTNLLTMINSLVEPATISRSLSSGLSSLPSPRRHGPSANWPIPAQDTTR